SKPPSVYRGSRVFQFDSLIRLSVWQARSGPKPSEMAKASVPTIKAGCRSRFGTIGRGPTSLASNRGIDT
ncbi:MAG: hypothetical protein ABUJ98_07825, partial [Hyphomicrobium sp.]